MIGDIVVTGFMYLNDKKKKNLQRFVNNDPTLTELK